MATVAALVIILALIAVVPSLLLTSITRLGDRLLHDTDALIDAVQDIDNAMVDQETGQRGYVITGDESFLEPYQEGVAALQALWPRAEAAATRVSGEAPARLATVEQAARAWQVQAGEPEIALVRAGQRDEAVRIVGLRGGKALFDAYRRDQRALDVYTEQVREAQTRERNRLSELLGALLFALTVLAAAGLALLLLLGRAALRARLRAAKSEAASREKDAFLSIAAHELKTPLTSIKGGAQLLLRRAARWEESDGPHPRDWEALLRLLSVIDRQATHLTALVEQLLDISRADLGRLALAVAPADLVAVVGGVIERTQATTARHPLRLVDAPPDLVVPMDEPRIEQVLDNLVGNAVKYSPEGGEVLVSVRRDGEYAVCAVHDQGMGIPQAEHPHLFDRFYRASNAEQTVISGFGVGLYVSRAIVEAHGGRIWVQSAVGQGSTFAFSLPLMPHRPVRVEALQGSTYD